MAKSINSKTVIAEVCLYGNSRTGAGYLVQTKDGQMFGDGDPKADRSFTAAVWDAIGGVLGRAANQVERQAWMELGAVRVFHPGGEFYTDIPLDQTIPTYGSLKSKPVTADMVHVITVEELLAAAKARREVAAVNYSIRKGGL